MLFKDKDIKSIMNSFSLDLGTEKINGEILLEIAEPMMFLINHFNNTYIGYVLQNRTIRTKNKKRAHVKELLITKTNFEYLIDLLEAKTSIFDFLDSSEKKYTIGQISDRVFPEIEIDSLSELSNRIPARDVKLDYRVLPNKVDTHKVLCKVIERKQRFSHYSYLENTFNSDFESTGEKYKDISTDQYDFFQSYSTQIITKYSNMKTEQLDLWNSLFKTNVESGE